MSDDNTTDDTASRERETIDEINKEIPKSGKRQQKARAEYESKLDAMTPKATQAEIEAVADLIVAANLGHTELKRATATLGKATKIGTRTAQSEIKEAQARAKKAAGDRARAKMGASGASDLEPIPRRFGEFVLSKLDGALWWFRDKDDGEAPEPIVSAYEIAEGFSYPDRDGQPYGSIVRLQTQAGEWREVELEPHEFVGTGTAALTKLRSAGMRFHGKDGPWLVLNHLMGVQPPGWAVVERPGWHAEAFVLPTGPALLTNRRIRLSEAVRIKADPPTGAQAEAALIEAKKALKILYTGKNRTVQAGGLAGLVGCGIDLTKAASVTYSLEGGSSIGKSSAEAVAAWIWGPPGCGDGLWISGNATGNGLETPLARSSGTVLATDESNRFKSAEQAENELFTVQQGAGKLRASGKGGNRPQVRFRTALLMSAEVGVAARLAQEGRTHAGGLAVRVLPIFTDNRPPPSEEDLEVFRVEHNAPVGSAFKHWGVVGPAYVQALKDQGYVDKPEEFTADVDALVSRLKPDGSMAKRAARMVAYLWQAALVAQDAGLIPEEFEAERFAKEIWAEACAGDLKPESRVLGAIERLAENLVAKRGVEIPDLTKKEDGTGIAGFTTDRVYREPVAWIAAHTAKPALKGGDKPEPQRVYVVPASKLLELAGCKVDGNSVTDRQLRKALVDEGYLCLPPMPPKGRQEFAFDGWPGLARTRYIVIFANMVEAEAEPPQAANEDGERSPDSARTRSHT